MLRRALASAVCLACISASPTTQTSDVAVTLEKASAAAAVAAQEKSTCENKVAEVKKQCLTRRHQTAAQRELDEKLTYAQNFLSEARKKGSPQERLDASGAYNRVRQAVADSEKKTINSDGVIRLLSEELKRRLETSTQSQQAVKRLESERQAKPQYAADHRDLIQAITKIDAAKQKAFDLSARSSGYERYQASATAQVESLQTVDKVDAKDMSDDDYAALVSAVGKNVEAWMSALSETEAIYSSADAIKAAAKAYAEASSWRKLEHDWSNKADASITKDNTDVAKAQLDAAENFLRNQVAALDNGRRKTELARRALLTRKNTVPATP